MRKYGFDNGHGKSFDYGLRFLEYPSFFYGREKVKETEIAGKENSYMEYTGCFENTVISNKLEFSCESLSDFETKMRDIRKWINRTQKVTYTDMEGRYFVVKRIEIEEKRLFHCIGQLSVTFVCDPYQYVVDGDTEQSITGTISYGVSGVLTNEYSVSHPIYIISGVIAMCNLNVNGTTVEVNVVERTYVDTERMLTYTDSGVYNRRLTGDYQDLYLIEGENTIQVTAQTSSPPKLKVIPRWRCI